jgi:uncharacterized repeat protein (TIGR01451 family)
VQLARLIRGNDRGGVSLRLLLSAAIVAASSSLGVVALGGPATAAKPGTVTICHATSAHNNPYIMQSPDNTADVGGHDGHIGAVWFAGITVQWGDIIPPFTADDGTPYAGKNWDTAGKEIHGNGCNTVAPDLRMTKTSTGGATTGSSGSYSLAVDNVGNGTATGPFSVTDVLPGGVVGTAVSGTGWTCTGLQSITCRHPGTLAPGASLATVTISLSWPTSATSVTNSATVAAVATETALANNTDSVTTSVTAGAADRLPVAVDDTATVTKGGAATAVAVLTNDIAGDGTTTVTAVGSATYGTASVPVGGGSVSYTPPAASSTATSDSFTYTITDADGDTSQALVTVTLADPISGGGDGGGGSPRSDLAIKKTGPAVVHPGDTVTWTLTVTSKGAGAASGFSVTDALPAGVQLVSIGGDGFACSPSTASCSYPGTLPAGSAAALSVVGVVTGAVADDSISNTGVVSPTDGTPQDNSDTLVTVVDRPMAPPAARADLVLEKRAGEEAVVAGDAISWTITVTNAGTGDVTGFEVVDDLVDGVTLTGVEAPGFECAQQATVRCVYPLVLEPGESVVLTLTGVIAEDHHASAVTNTATAVFVDDPTPANNEDTATTAVLTPITGSPVNPRTGPQPSQPGRPQPQPGAPAPPLSGAPTPQAATLPPATLPFTGTRADLMLGLGTGLSVIGLLLALTGRRRRFAE